LQEPAAGKLASVVAPIKMRLAMHTLNRFYNLLSVFGQRMNAMSHSTKDVLVFRAYIWRAARLIFSHSLENGAIARDPFFATYVSAAPYVISSELIVLIQGDDATHRSQYFLGG